jgi:hypothetical protein
MTPEEILQEFTGQVMARATSLNQIRILIKKRKEEMHLRYETDRIKYAKMPFDTWDHIDKLVIETTAINSTLMELIGKIEDSSSMAEKMGIFAKAFSRSSEAQLAHATLIDAIRKANDAYTKYAENPEEDMEELDLPDTVFEMDDSENTKLEEAKAEVKAHKAMADTLTNLSEMMTNFEQLDKQTNAIVDKIEESADDEVETEEASTETTKTEEAPQVTEEVTYEQMSEAVDEVLRETATDTPVPVEETAISSLNQMIKTEESSTVPATSVDANKAKEAADREATENMLRELNGESSSDPTDEDINKFLHN